MNESRPGPARVSYITAVNRMIVEACARYPDLVSMGENINQGSCIGGMTRHLSGRVLNLGNCENTHCGAGFGVMLGGGRAVLFVKQLDFLLLAMDQIVNTYNLVRCQGRPEGSFTIVVIVCDQGMQGPQSSFNALAGLCWLGRLDGYTLTNRAETEHVLFTQIGAPGFRIIALSQRLFATEMLAPELLEAAADGAEFQYWDGKAATIACFNFSLPQGLALARRMQAEGRNPALFTAHPVMPQRWERIGASARKTGRLIVLDDAKGTSSIGYQLLGQVPGCRGLVLTRGDQVGFGVTPDRFSIDEQAVLEAL